MKNFYKIFILNLFFTCGCLFAAKNIALAAGGELLYESSYDSNGISSLFPLSMTANNDGIFVVGTDNGEAKWRVKKYNSALVDSGMSYVAGSKGANMPLGIGLYSSSGSDVFSVGKQTTNITTWDIKRHLASNLSLPSGGESYGNFTPFSDARAQCVASNGSSIFVGGYTNSILGGHDHWRIQKMPIINLATNDWVVDENTADDPNSADGADVVADIAVFGNSVYAAGGEAQTIEGVYHSYFRIEKRNAATGALELKQFGSAEQANPYYSTRISIDKTGNYIYDAWITTTPSMVGGQFLEKRRTSDLSLVWSRSLGDTLIADIACDPYDASAIFIAREKCFRCYVGTNNWYIEKIDSDGNLLWSQKAGNIDYNYLNTTGETTPMQDPTVSTIAVGSDGVYSAGRAYFASMNGFGWRIEKRGKDNNLTILNISYDPLSIFVNRPFAVTVNTTGTATPTMAKFVLKESTTAIPTDPEIPTDSDWAAATPYYWSTPIDSVWTLNTTTSGTLANLKFTSLGSKAIWVRVQDGNGNVATSPIFVTPNPLSLEITGSADPATLPDSTSPSTTPVTIKVEKEACLETNLGCPRDAEETIEYCLYCNGTDLTNCYNTSVINTPYTFEPDRCFGYKNDSINNQFKVTATVKVKETLKQASYEKESIRSVNFPASPPASLPDDPSGATGWREVKVSE